MIDRDDHLEGLFRAARADRAVPPDEDWLARVTGDALAEAAAARVARPPVPRGLASQLRALLGGWRGLGGLAAARVAGLVIGLSAPEVMKLPVDGAIWSNVFDDALLDVLDGGNVAVVVPDTLAEATSAAFTAPGTTW